MNEKSAKEQSTTNPATSKPPKDVGQAEMQKAADTDNDKGYVGEKVDQTPDEHYSVSGVTAGKPTPETDADAKAAAMKPADPAKPAKK